MGSRAGWCRLECGSWLVMSVAYAALGLGCVPCELRKLQGWTSRVLDERPGEYWAMNSTLDNLFDFLVIADFVAGLIEDAGIMSVEPAK